MHVSMAANRLIPKPSRRIGHHAEQEIPANVHRNRIRRIGFIAVRVPQARADRIEPPQLRLGSEHIRAVPEAQRMRTYLNIETAINRQNLCRAARVSKWSGGGIAQC